MSTSPSWFDQEKFSRLVKKVGPKNAPEPAPAAPSAETDPRPEGMASTARISLVSRPPSLLSEHRALPALPRRTAPLPGLKSLFQSPGKTDEPGESAPTETPAPAESASKVEDAPKIDAPKSDESKGETSPETNKPSEPETSESHVVEPNDVEGIWQKMGLLNEELAQTIQERDQAVADAHLLRDQLRMSDESLEGGQSDATKEEFARLIRERDAALAEAASLKAQAQKPSAPPTFGKPPEGLSKTKELVMLTTERDQARKEYADLRKQFELVKQGQGTGPIPGVPSSSSKEESSKFRKDMEQQLEGLSKKLEERNREIAELKAGGATASGGGSGSGGDAALREQLQKTKEELSVAQRGLALSQKALHETRDTLREATEGTSLSRHNFDNLKNECATLSQQNTVLQAQNDQLSRELAAAKSKLTTRV